MTHKFRFSKSYTALLILAGLAFAVSISTANACSRIMVSKNPKHIVVSRSVDWHVDTKEEFFIYPRGTERTGEVDKNPAKWKSKYGVIVNNLSLWSFDAEAMNEKGFAIHTLYLAETKYEKRDDRPGVSYLRVCRFFADNCTTVKEGLALLKKIQIVPVLAEGKILPTHWAMEDATGDSAIIEFVKGKMVVHHGKELTVMCNEPTYDEHMRNLKEYKGFGGKKSLPGGTESWERFIRAKYYSKYLPEPKNEAEAVAFAFQLIQNVAVPYGAPYKTGAGAGVYPTWWASVSDLSNKFYYFKSTFSPNTIWVDLNRVDFSPGAPVLHMAYPRDPSFVGDVTRSFKKVE